jgi:hypothetical protein
MAKTFHRGVVSIRVPFSCLAVHVCIRLGCKFCIVKNTLAYFLIVSMINNVFNINNNVL